MPYKPVKRGSKWEVFKVDDNGNPTGKGLGTHDSKQEAEEQITALNIAEAEKDKEAKTKMTHPVMEEDKMMDEVKMYPGGGATSLKQMIQAKKAYEAAKEVHELTDMFQDVVGNILASESEEKGALLIQAANEFADMARSAIQETKKGPMEKAINSIKGLFETKQAVPFSPDDAPGDMPNPKRRQWADAANKAMRACVEEGSAGESACRSRAKRVANESLEQSKELYIWKEGDIYKWIAAYSNNRRDNDNPPEIISSESHKTFDKELNDGIHPMPELWLWHIDYPVGVTQYHTYDKDTGFPVAAGIFYPGMDWAAEGIIKAGWRGVSHGMPRKYIRRDEKDNSVITRHVTKEITLLPQWAAANKLSFHLISKEETMQDEKGLPAHKRDDFIKAFGEEKVKTIEAALADKAKEADDDGIEKKSKDTDKTKDSLVKSVQQLLEAVTYLNDELITVKEQLKAKEQSEPEGEFDLVSFLKSKSAVGSDAAKVDGRSTLAKDAPVETEPESPSQQASGFPIGLVDRIVSLNQQYQNGGKQ